MADPHRIGIDLGGTKTECVLLDPQGETVFRERRPTPKADYGAIVAVIAALVGEARARIDGASATIGIAIPGAVEPGSGRIKNANTTSLIGERLGDDLAARLGQPVAIANDANCFALSEAVDGAAAGAKCVFGAILGTGVGGGIVIDEEMIEGANRIGGEWGHNPFPFRGEAAQGRLCYCGRTDCIETVLSGPALARSHAERAGGKRSAEEIRALAEAGDAAATGTMEIYVERLAMALASVINLLDPDVIVLGGGLSNIERLYSDLPDALNRHVFNASADPVRLATRIVRNKWGDSSGVRGAAWLRVTAA